MQVLRLCTLQLGMTFLHCLQFKLRQETDDVSYAVIARGEGAHPAGDAVALRDYFNLGTRLAPLAAGWAAADKRFRDVQPYIPGNAPEFRL
jgi:hypothetical protein